MKRLKAWFHSVVVAEVEKVLASLLGGFKKTVEDHIVTVLGRERRALGVLVELAKSDIQAAATTLRVDCLDRLEAGAGELMETELKAFEARVQHTLEACIKDDPSHWRADEETRQLDKAHQQIEK